MEKTFAMISLGCAKNLVNSEQMLYLLSEAGYTLVPEADGADLAVVNTCGNTYVQLLCELDVA